jgi:hypothetical protein
MAQEPFLSAVDVARLLSCSMELVQEKLGHLALELPGGELRWRRESVLAALRPVPPEKGKA